MLTTKEQSEVVERLHRWRFFLVGRVLFRYLIVKLNMSQVVCNNNNSNKIINNLFKASKSKSTKLIKTNNRENATTKYL